MKRVFGAFFDHLSQDSTTLAVLWKVVRQDGVVLGFTNHDQDIVQRGGNYGDLLVRYMASTGFTNSASTSASDMSVDNMEVTGFLDSSAIDEEDVRAHLYDNALVEMRIVNWADLDMGELKVLSGAI